MEEDIKTEDITLKDEELKIYELGYHLLPTITETEVSKEVDVIKSVIEKQGGVVISENAPKSMQLAYTIIRREGGKRHKFDRSYFGWIKFETSVDGVSELETILRENEQILRFLFINTVRESTLMPKRVFFEKTETPATHLSKPTIMTPVKKEEKQEPVSEKELDKKIEELVVE